MGGGGDGGEAASHSARPNYSNYVVVRACQRCTRRPRLESDRIHTLQFTRSRLAVQRQARAEQMQKPSPKNHHCLVGVTNIPHNAM